MKIESKLFDVQDVSNCNPRVRTAAFLLVQPGRASHTEDDLCSPEKRASLKLCEAALVER